MPTLFHFFMALSIICFIGVLALLPITRAGLAETKLERFCVHVLMVILYGLTVVGILGTVGFANA